MVEVRPTVFGGVPRVWEKLKAGLEAAGLRDPSQLPEAGKALVRARLGLGHCTVRVSGAAPAAMEVLQYFHDLGLPLNEGWGMSELSCFATMNPPGDVRMGTVGKALPGVELRLLDDGELLVRAPLVMKGYRDDPERTAEALDAEGWLHTGDVGHVDAEGCLHITDRKKDMIISGGFNVYPSEVEQVLWGHPAVQDCAVIGVPDEKWGEAVKAVVELNAGQQVSAAELIELCKDKLGSVKAPKSIDFVDALPRSPVGKVLKKDLRAKYWQDASRRI
jgi:acyl-CoA synthetase (AMP-forming)/AMP-acid ligase II